MRGNKPGVFSIEGIMNSLEGLKIAIESFDLPEGGKTIIEGQMRRCDKCRSWQFNEDLIRGTTCESCSEKENPKNHTPDSSLDKKNYEDTVYISLQKLVGKGLSIEESLEYLCIEKSIYEKEVSETRKATLEDMVKIRQQITPEKYGWLKKDEEEEL